MNKSSIIKSSAFVLCTALLAAPALAAPLAAPALATTVTPAAPAAPAAPGAKAPIATILYLDRAIVLRQSSVGKDLSTQVNALINKMETDFAPESKKLQADAEALRTVADAAARQAKVKELETRRQALQKKLQDRQAAIQNGLNQSRQKVEQALGPILERIMIERSANLLLDRGLVVLGKPEQDITTTVIARLNTTLPKVVITPAAPAPGAQPKPPATAAGH